MRVEVLLPQWGAGMRAGTVTAWKVEVGDAVDEGDVLAEIETEKVVQELESPATGTITAILVGEGQDAEVRTTLAIIESDG